MDKPILTIGIPVYNESKYLTKTIESAINQSFGNIRILIADNCSLDNSFEIMKSFAAKDNRIEIIRHNQNLGALKNFQYLLINASTKYFMWLGGHDIIPEDYAYNLINQILLNRDSVMSFGSVNNIDNNENIVDFYQYNFNEELISFDYFERVYSLIKNLEDCTLIQGVFLTDVLIKSFFDKPCLGVDHIILAKAISFGKFVYDINTQYKRREVREEDLLEANKRRCKEIGDSNNKPENNYQDLQIEQLKIIKELKTRNLFKKIIWIYRSKQMLERRFGKFKRN